MKGCQTRRLGQAVSNARGPRLPPGVRYARAFDTLGGVNMSISFFSDGRRADMFFSAPEQDRWTMEAIISGVGLRPIYLGEDQEVLIDGLFQLWVTLAFIQGHGRRLAFKLLEGSAVKNPARYNLSGAVCSFTYGEAVRERCRSSELRLPKSWLQLQDMSLVRLRRAFCAK